MPDMLDIMEKFAAIRVLLVGDMHLDEQVNGDMTGISTEGNPTFDSCFSKDGLKNDRTRIEYFGSEYGHEGHAGYFRQNRVSRIIEPNDDHCD